MDRLIIELHLAQAERHVIESEHHVARQRELIATMERDGHDTLQARATLAQFEEMQALHRADRDRLRQELRHTSPQSSA